MWPLPKCSAYDLKCQEILYAFGLQDVDVLFIVFERYFDFSNATPWHSIWHFSFHGVVCRLYIVGISNTSESAGPRCTTALPAAPKQKVCMPPRAHSQHTRQQSTASLPQLRLHTITHHSEPTSPVHPNTRPTKQKLCINGPTAYRRTRPQTMRSPTGAIRTVELVRDMQDPTASSILHVSTHQPKGADASFSPVPWTFSPSSFL